MKKIELLCDVDGSMRNLEGQKKAADAFGMSPRAKIYPRLKVKTIRGAEVRFVKGAQIEVSDATAAKCIERNVAKEVPIKAAAEV